MNLIGLLSWFDEPVPSLLASLRAMAEAGTDHIVACDGRYALYSADHDCSHPNEYAAIVLACRELGMRCTIHQPSGPWEGGEVEKRTFLFALALSVAQEGDWFWVQDADQVVMHVPADFKARLHATEHDVATVRIHDIVAAAANVPTWPADFTMPALFRAQPITVGPAHCQYNAADGTLLWGYDGDARQAPALDLSDVVLVEHRPQDRPQERLVAKHVYYAARDAARIERSVCEFCGKPATGQQPARWRMTELGPVATWVECCEECKAKLEIVNEVELRKFGIDVDTMQVGPVLGVPPPPVPRERIAEAARRNAGQVGDEVPAGLPGLRPLKV